MWGLKERRVVLAFKTFFVLKVNLLDIIGFGLRLDAFMGVMLNMRPIKS